MVEPIRFSVKELADKTDPSVPVALNALAGADSSSLPREIEDSVTLSPEALAASSRSNLLAFAKSQDAASSSAIHSVSFSGQSQTEALLNQGYSLSEIVVEFDLPLADVQSAFGIHTLDTAA